MRQFFLCHRLQRMTPKKTSNHLSSILSDSKSLQDGFGPKKGATKKRQRERSVVLKKLEGTALSKTH